MATVLFMSSLDTRSREALYAKECIERLGCKVALLDLSMGAYKDCGADYTCIDVAREEGVPFEQVSGTRGTAENTKIMRPGCDSDSQETVR